MKIALVGTSLFQHGAEYVMAALARGLAKKGHQIDVVLSKYQDAWQKENPSWVPFELPDNVRKVVLPQYRGRYMVLSLRNLMQKEHYDVVMSHASPYSIPMVLACFAMRRRPILIHVEHACGVGVDSLGNRLEPSAKIQSRLKNFVMRGFDAQFAVSSGTADAINRMTGYPREKITPVFNPVVDAVFNHKIAQEPDHPWLKDATMPVVVAGGVFQPYKNHLMLFDAFAEVLKKKKARLIIFGEGPMRDEYDQRLKELGIKQYVSLPGHTENLPAAIRKAACYVVSSTVESFSVVCVEALACGTPVVSTNCPYGPPEILQNGKYGILVENKNQHALAEGILKVLNGQGIKPPPESWQPYTAEAIVERYEKAIQKVMEKN